MILSLLLYSLEAVVEIQVFNIIFFQTTSFANINVTDGGTGGKGGGYLRWDVGRRLEMNGILRAKGQIGVGGNAGGGSGGSIVLKAENITGLGRF